MVRSTPSGRMSAFTRSAHRFRSDGARRDSFGQIGIGGLQYPVYDIALIAVSLIVAATVWYTLNRTRIGRCVTAVVFDSEISAAMGIHVGRIKTGTFIVGAALG